MSGARRGFSTLVCALLLAALLGAGRAAATPGSPSDTGTPGSPSSTIPEDWLIDDRVVVGFETGDPVLRARVEEVAAGHGARILRVDHRLDFAAITVPPDRRDALVAALRPLSGVRYAKPDARVEASYVPNDPHYVDQWGPPAIGMEEAWNTTRGEHNRVVAVIDTGVRSTHVDLAPNYCVSGPNYVIPGAPPLDDHGHGTHVAGTVAAAINNSQGVAGMANVCIMAIKVLDAAGFGAFSDVASAVAWATDHGAHVTNMSLGGCPGCDPGPPMSTAVAYAWQKGVLNVAAAGNDDCDRVGFPAGYKEVVAVASLDYPGTTRSSFSSCGPEVEISAPGRDIISTYNLTDVSYASFSGTSMAAPHVSGVAALVWSRDTTRTNADVRCLLRATADDLGPAGADPMYGTGRIDAAGAVGLPTVACDPLWPEALPDLVVSGVRTDPPNPRVGDTVTFTATVRNQGTGSASASTTAFDVDGVSLGNHATPTLGPGESTTLTSPPFTITTTSHVVTVTADAGGAVREASETNNRLVESVGANACPFPCRENFDDGVADHFGLSGLWHVSGACDATPPSPPSVLTYNTDATCTYDGGRTAGVAVLKVDLTGVARAELRFQHRYEGEWQRGGYGYDVRRLEVSTDGGATWSSLVDYSFPTVTRGWQPVTVDLTPYVGGIVRVRWLFDSVDDQYNNFLGWLVDDVVVDVPTLAPDLVVTATATTPQFPFAGEQVTMQAVVANVGEGGSPATTTEFKLRDGTRFSVSTPALSPGARVTVGGASWAAAPGPQPVTVTADAGNTVTESDEANNPVATTVVASGCPRNDTRAQACVVPQPSKWNHGRWINVQRTDGFDTDVPPDELPACGVGFSTAWFRYSHPQDSGIQRVEVSTATSQFETYDTVLAVYLEHDGRYVPVSCNNDEGRYKRVSRLTFTALPGRTYYIQAGGFLGDSGTLVLTVNYCPRPTQC